MAEACAKEGYHLFMAPWSSSFRKAVGRYIPSCRRGRAAYSEHVAGRRIPELDLLDRQFSSRILKKRLFKDTKKLCSSTHCSGIKRRIHSPSSYRKEHKHVRQKKNGARGGLDPRQSTDPKSACQAFHHLRMPWNNTIIKGRVTSVKNE